ncbi:MAG: class I SAM-dependent methyltransferase [Gallionella sp.]|nr:class I SAM-dependent methyltransferase [Gallionella sp.]
MFKKIPPAIKALLLQFAALLLVLFVARATDMQPSFMTFALLCGLCAAVFSYLAGLQRWWLPIQLVFVPALVLMLALSIPPGFYLAAFLLLLAVYWSVFRTQVPLYLSSDKVWHALEDVLQDAQSGFRFIDLGSGLGGVLTHLASVRPDGRYSGVESAPLPFVWSWLRIKLGGYRNCKVHWGSIWDDSLGACDLGQYDVVFAYLSPVPMERLWNKARAEMRAGTVFVSSTFAVPEQSPSQTLQVDDLHRSRLLIWRM